MCLKRSKDRLQSLSKSVDVETASESNFLLQPRHMHMPLDVLAFFALEPVAVMLTLSSDDGDPTLLLGEPLGRPSFFLSPSPPPSRPSPPLPRPQSKASQRSSATSPSSDAVRHGAAGTSPSSANMAAVPGNKNMFITYVVICIYYIIIYMGTCVYIRAYSVCILYII